MKATVCSNDLCHVFRTILFLLVTGSVAITPVLMGCSKGADDPTPKPVTPPIISEFKILESSGTYVKVSAKTSGAVEKGFLLGTDKIICDNTFEATFEDLVPFSIYEINAYARNGGGLTTETLTFQALCPSDLGGTYTYHTQVTGSVLPYSSCLDLNGTVTFTKYEHGKYHISDISFGLSDCVWSDNPMTGVSLLDTCDKVELTGSDQYGLIYTWIITANNGTQLTIDWHNDYGDSGITTITGVWPMGLSMN